MKEISSYDEKSIQRVLYDHVAKSILASTLSLILVKLNINCIYKRIQSEMNFVSFKNFFL